MKRKTVFFILGVMLSLHYCSQDQKSNHRVQPHPALQKKAIAHGLGVNIHFYKGNDNDLRMLTESGVGIVRMDVSWAGAEKESGHYDFSRYDQLVADLGKMGARLLFILDYGNPLYDNGNAPFSDEGRRAYARFCQALASHFAGRNIIWELWNEPNLDKFWRPKSNVNDYVAWCKAVVPAIRKADASACIIGPAVSSIDFAFLEDCFKQGLLRLVDGVSVHPYRSPKRGPETAEDEFRLLRLLIDQYRPEGKNIPIISGEWGYNTAVMSRELQGKYLPRQWLCNLANGIPISIWYDWHDDGQNPNEPEHNFGTVTWDYHPKPAYRAMKTLIHNLRGYVPVDRIGVGDVEDYALLFMNGRNAKLALWTTGTPHAIALDENLHIAKAVDIFGQPLNITNGSELSLSESPIYLTLATPFPGWLQVLADICSIKLQQARTLLTAIGSGKALRDPPGKLLQGFLNHGSELEKRVAYHALFELARQLANEKQRVRIYRRILEAVESAVIDKRDVLYEMSAEADETSEEIVRSFLAIPATSQAASCYFARLAEKSLEKNDFNTAQKYLVLSARGATQRYQTARVLSMMKGRGYEPDVSAVASRIGFISHWWVVGPFPNEKDRGERRVFFPERKIDFSQSATFHGATVEWRELKTEDLWGIIPFADLYGRIQKVAYAFTTLNVPRSMQAVFKIGSNDGVVCWLNGVKVHANFASRPLIIDEDRVAVTLKRGRNEILLKIPNKGANWEACLRVCDENGVAMDISSFVE